MTDYGTGAWGTGKWGNTPIAALPPKLVGAGNWGATPWGCSHWGGQAGGGPPILGAVGPALCDVKGGTVLGLFGDNFTDPTVIEVVDPIGLETLGTAHYFEARLDLRNNKILAGFPALPQGTYGVKVTTAGGVSSVLLDAVTYEPFADEGKVQRVRRRWSPFWGTGERILK